jgi:hypothetical protein
MDYSRIENIRRRLAAAGFCNKRRVSAASLHQSIGFAVTGLQDRIPDNAQVGAEMI